MCNDSLCFPLKAVTLVFFWETMSLEHESGNALRTLLPADSNKNVAWSVVLRAQSIQSWDVYTLNVRRNGP